MKNLILIPLFLFSSLVVFGNGNPLKSIVLLESSSITVSVDKDLEGLFKKAEISDDKENIDFVTHKNIDVIQIFDERGNLEFQLPVESNKVRINKNLFGEGDYKLGFKVEGDFEVKYADVSLK